MNGAASSPTRSTTDANGSRTGNPYDFERVVVVLIKPTSYDDDGYPYRFLRGVLPSNSLAIMYALTRDALTQVLPSTVDVEVVAYEDGIKNHATKLKRLMARFPEEGTKLVVGMVAVQSAQFPRACDLLDRWQARGATCVIGGFHVSGSISTMLDGINDPKRPGIPSPHRMPSEIEELMDKGVILFHGEAEEQWANALSDILQAKPKSLYRGGLPALHDAVLPSYPPRYFEKSFATRIDTFDTGRGCPYACSFCTVINVQGRVTRFRDPQSIAEAVERICVRDGEASFFFTDDNFARNPQWREILSGLSNLRKRGWKISFMIEADLALDKLKGFLPMLAEAGCSQVFMGVESMNPRNLEDANKRQNQVHRFEALWDKCHKYGIAVHAAYIIGFPHDTTDSVADDVARLQALGADQASFFMLTPLPGSEDHARAVASGAAIDNDLNQCDSFHPITDHPNMTREQWAASYAGAWRQFYRVGNMVKALKRFARREDRQYLLRNFVWYRWSFATERVHPMIAGFYRFRDFDDRRPSARPTAYLRHLGQEFVRHVRYGARFLAEFYRFQHVVLESEYAFLLAKKRDAFRGKLGGLRDWVRMSFGRVMTREWLNRFWIAYASKKWNLLINPWTYRWHVYMLPHAFTEVVYTLRFALQFRRLVKATT
jgi:radical SAM superfamily enzyme YgiQ (UPF0313 family)